MKHESDPWISFWSRVSIGDGCWEWAGGKRSFGYGSIKWQGKFPGAHRVAWMLTNGDIPSGASVLHKCDNPPCVRPDHLFLGDHAENMKDMARKGRASKEGFHGEEHPRAKLNWEKVKEIRSYPAGTSKRALAGRYGVTCTLIRYVIQGKIWK